MADWQVVAGGVTAPKGFKAAGIAAGLKPSGAPDLALIFSETPAIAAGVFTQTQVRAACVDYCRQCLDTKAVAQAILCNAGQANAATGAQGWADAVTSAEQLATHLNIPAQQVLIASTGVIGQRIKLDNLVANLPTLINQLSPDGSDAAAQAIVTTDLVTKSIALETHLGDRPVRIGGISKGSGMIHPNMATMLGFVTCDATVSPALWQAMLRRVADRSFNQITVDGDTSTNDSLIALANGESRTPAITESGPDADKLEAMLTTVCQYLAQAIARDGEGATCLMEVTVTGTANEAAARQIARTIAGSALTKSALFGRDPNWGRIAAAAGRAGIPFEQNELKVELGDFVLMVAGQPQPFDRAAASAYLKTQAEKSELAPAAALAAGTLVRPPLAETALAHPVQLRVSVGTGPGRGTAWGCDLSYDYVRINAEYTT